MKKVFLNELIENLDLTKAEKWYKMEKEKIIKTPTLQAMSNSIIDLTLNKNN